MTQWRDPPPIEPLSDTSWKRIERGLYADLDRVMETPEPAPVRRFRFKAWYGVAAAAAVAAALLVVLLPSGDEPAPAVATASRVVTNDAPTQLTIGRADLDIAAQSALWVNVSRDVTVILEKGKVECSVARRADRSPFVVQAGDVRVEVIGTKFSVSREQDDVAVEVTEGIVQVVHDGKLTRVQAGERWPTEVEDAEDAEDADSDSRDAEVTIDDGDGEVAAGTSRSKRRKKQRLSQKQRYETAASLEASDPAAALAIYSDLSRKSSSWGANALYARARLELERNNEKVAKKLLLRYLRRHPRGANAADARALLERLK